MSVYVLPYTYKQSLHNAFIVKRRIGEKMFQDIYYNKLSVYQQMLHFCTIDARMESFTETQKEMIFTFTEINPETLCYDNEAIKEIIDDIKKTIWEEDSK